MRHKQSNQGQSDDVKDGDAPEDLFDGSWQRFPRVGGLGSSEPDELRTSEGESGRDEDRAKPLKAVVEGAWVLPVLAANVAAFGRAANIEDNSEQAVPSERLFVAWEERTRTLTYMKLMTAMTLMMENMNSASP